MKQWYVHVVYISIFLQAEWPQVDYVGASTFEDRIPVHDRGAHEHHAITRHCRWRRVVDVVHLKHDLAAWRHGDTISIGKCQGLVVIQHRVQVLNPDGVHRAIQQQPDIFTLMVRMQFFLYDWVSEVSGLLLICFGECWPNIIRPH